MFCGFTIRFSLLRASSGRCAQNNSFTVLNDTTDHLIVFDVRNTLFKFLTVIVLSRDWVVMIGSIFYEEVDVLYTIKLSVDFDIFVCIVVRVSTMIFNWQLICSLIGLFGSISWPLHKCRILLWRWVCGFRWYFHDVKINLLRDFTV